MQLCDQKRTRTNAFLLTKPDVHTTNYTTQHHGDILGDENYYRPASELGDKKRTQLRKKLQKHILRYATFML